MYLEKEQKRRPAAANKAKAKTKLPKTECLFPLFPFFIERSLLLRESAFAVSLKKFLFFPAEPVEPRFSAFFQNFHRHAGLPVLDAIVGLVVDFPSRQVFETELAFTEQFGEQI